MSALKIRRPQWKRMMGTLKTLPQSLLQLLLGKWDSLQTNLQTAPTAHTLLLSKEGAESVKAKLKQALQEEHSDPEPLTAAEQSMLASIRQETAQLNRNNTTRTAAYADMYRMHPELHWAFLAHCVSRNGGWSMTDLNGDLLPRLLNQRQREAVFLFLERANSLIFGDAYPQLLLYREGQKHQTNLSHLLPHLSVSKFMRPVWDTFWQHQDCALLTTGLIINEQNYIEGRIVRNDHFKASVLETMFFQTQSMLQLNHVVFPYEKADHPGSLRLAGLILENFGDLQERIEIGKKLYGILFGIPSVHEGVRRFTATVPHTGSRADYWPQLYISAKKTTRRAVHKDASRAVYKINGVPQPGPSADASAARLVNCSLKPGAERYYSPKLEDAWRDRPIPEPAPGDWCRDLSPLAFFESIQPPLAFDMTNECCFGLNKLELAVLAGTQFR